jgi:hypothetical protein
MLMPNAFARDDSSSYPNEFTKLRQNGLERPLDLEREG